jgi:hypothetical protein
VTGGCDGAKVRRGAGGVAAEEESKASQTAGGVD